MFRDSLENKERPERLESKVTMDSSASLSYPAEDQRERTLISEGFNGCNGVAFATKNNGIIEIGLTHYGPEQTELNLNKLRQMITEKGEGKVICFTRGSWIQNIDGKYEMQVDTGFKSDADFLNTLGNIAKDKGLELEIIPYQFDVNPFGSGIEIKGRGDKIQVRMFDQFNEHLQWKYFSLDSKEM